MILLQANDVIFSFSIKSTSFIPHSQFRLLICPSSLGGGLYIDVLMEVIALLRTSAPVLLVGLVTIAAPPLVKL